MELRKSEGENSTLCLDLDETQLQAILAKHITESVKRAFTQKNKRRWEQEYKKEIHKAVTAPITPSKKHRKKSQ